jgi:hypothetical protein
MPIHWIDLFLLISSDTEVGSKCGQNAMSIGKIRRNSKERYLIFVGDEVWIIQREGLQESWSEIYIRF